MIRGEALYTSRSAWFVCFPGIHGKDCLTNFKGPGRDGKDEIPLAERTLSLFSALAEMGINDKARLMTAGAAARATMRSAESATDEEVKSAALSTLGIEGGVSVDGGRSASREESPELEDCVGGTREVSECLAEVLVAEIMHEAKVKAEPEPPMPPPPQDPPPPSSLHLSVPAPMNEKASVKDDGPALAAGTLHRLSGRVIAQVSQVHFQIWVPIIRDSSNQS